MEDARSLRMATRGVALRSSTRKSADFPFSRLPVSVSRERARAPPSVARNQSWKGLSGCLNCWTFKRRPSGKHHGVVPADTLRATRRGVQNAVKIERRAEEGSNWGRARCVLRGDSKIGSSSVDGAAREPLASSSRIGYTARIGLRKELCTHAPRSISEMWWHIGVRNFLGPGGSSSRRRVVRSAE